MRLAYLFKSFIYFSFGKLFSYLELYCGNILHYAALSHRDAAAGQTKKRKQVMETMSSPPQSTYRFLYSAPTLAGVSTLMLTHSIKYVQYCKSYRHERKHMQM